MVTQNDEYINKNMSRGLYAPYDLRQVCEMIGYTLYSSILSDRVNCSNASDIDLKKTLYEVKTLLVIFM